MKSEDLENPNQQLMEAHPHIAEMKQQFQRHKVAYMAVGVCAGICVLGVATAASGSISMASMNDAILEDEKARQSVTVLGGTEEAPTSRGWFTKKKETEPETTGGFCWSCDNAPSRGWNWNWGYGKCQCYENWSGPCCDTAVDVTLVTHGPYMGSPGTYELWTFETKNTADSMDYAKTDGTSLSGSVPPEFAGLWWMDGNPASDYVASFGRSNWQSVADGYECENSKLINAGLEEGDPNREIDCLGGLDINVYDENIWSWHDESLGRLVYGAVLGVQLTYTFECGGDDNGKLTYCQVFPNAAIPVTAGGSWISVPPSLVSFDMTRANDDLWIRNSYIAGLSNFPHNYYLKNIVKGDGSKGEHWDDYMSHGHAQAPVEADVFGNGADTRELVSDVHATQCLSRKLE